VVEASEVELPDIARALAGLLEQVPRPDRPLLVALAERLAVERYRRWAEEPSLRAYRAELLACAAREEEIAERVEGLRPDAVDAQRELRASHPELLDVNRSLFAGLPLARQLLLQSRGERLGAATWRSFAKRAEAGDARAFGACAELEEQSARALEAILASRS